jgi:branched-chain amino acid transport system ATP-binding protein
MSQGIEITGVSRSFGGIAALRNVSLGIGTGELVALIGPNGSGKTTLLNCLTGHLAPDLGEIRLRGSRIDRLRPEAIARLGLSRMFQLTRLFRSLSVMDNLMTVAFAMGFDQAEGTRRATALLELVGLLDFAGDPATALSGGQRKLVEFAMCFMPDAGVVLLDEPFSAISAPLKSVMVAAIQDLHARGITIVVVSHDMPIVNELCPRTICMSGGEVLADGPTVDVLTNDAVIEAYLGGAPA